jgi:hypothetical protein
VRAVSLSNTRVISLLNRYYVPVYLSNEDYAETGAAPKAEKGELRRILDEGYKAGLSVGSVHVYILTPEGHTLDSMHTAQAAEAARLIGLLERSVQRLGTMPGDPVVTPTAPSAPSCVAGGLPLHLTARYLERRGEELALTGQGEHYTGDWSSLPSEDWIELTREQRSKLIPPAGAREGQSWEIDPETTTAMFTHFYPPTENWDLSTHRFEQRSLAGTVVSAAGGRVRVRLQGRLRMSHSFYHKEDGNFVEASVVGYLDYERATRQVRSLRLVTDEALYHRTDETALPFGVAVADVPTTPRH